MLPALADTKPSLADVFPSCLSAIRGEQNRLRLPPVRTAIVLLVDGLGSAALAARAGHARTLHASSTTLQSGFPTTTASALATLTTGTAPGQHGLVGYSVLDAANDRVINQLSGWDGIDPFTWQPQPTIFEQAVDAGYAATVIAPGRYRDSPFTHAVLRGATFVAAESIAERLEAATTLSGLIYVYVPELDKLAHQHGVESTQWTVALESLDGLVASLRLAVDVGMLVTADHGVIDVMPHNHILYDTVPELMAGSQIFRHFLQARGAGLGVGDIPFVNRNSGFAFEGAGGRVARERRLAQLGGDEGAGSRGRLVRRGAP